MLSTLSSTHQRMYNFKGEPISLLKKLTEISICLSLNCEDKQQEMGISRYPVVMRDFFTDQYYNGLFDPSLDQFSDDFPLTPTSKGSVESFMLSHGHPPPILYQKQPSFLIQRPQKTRSI